MSRQLHYSTGESYLIVGPAIAALTGDAELGQRIWPLIELGATGHAVLEEALRGGLSTMPDLLLIEFDANSTRVFVRGPHYANVRLGDGSMVSCSGEDATTWSERVFDDAGAGSVDTETATRLPIVAGVVTASGFDWESDNAVERPWSPARYQASATEKQCPPQLQLVRSVPEPQRAGGAAIHTTSEPAPPPRPAPAPQEVEAQSAPFDHSLARPGADVVRNAGGPTVHQISEDLQPADAVSPAESFAPLVATGPTQTPPVQPGLIETRTEPADEGFDHLFGSTIYRSVEEAAVREEVEGAGSLVGEPVSPDPSPAAPDGPIGDHDGSTIMVSALAALPQLPLDREVHGAASAPPAVLELSTGDRVPLDRGVVIGRRPQIDRVAGDAIPRMITVESPAQDISRSHIQITTEGENYTVTDLHSMNGSVVIGPDGVSRILSSGDKIVLRIDDVIDIGEGVTVTLRRAP